MPVSLTGFQKQGTARRGTGSAPHAGQKWRDFLDRFQRQIDRVWIRPIKGDCEKFAASAARLAIKNGESSHRGVLWDRFVAVNFVCEYTEMRVY